MNDRQLNGKEILQELFEQFGQGQVTIHPYLQNQRRVALKEGSMMLVTEFSTNVRRLEVFSSQQLGDVVLTLETSREDPRTLIVIPRKKPFDLGDPIAREVSSILSHAAELVAKKQFILHAPDLALR